MKNFATSTIQVLSSITTRPPEPMIALYFLTWSKSSGTSRCLFYETSAGWSTDLNTLEFTAALETASDIINDGTECGSHRNFDKTGIVYVTGKCECLGSRASFCTDASVPLNTIG